MPTVEAAFMVQWKVSKNLLTKGKSFREQGFAHLTFNHKQRLDKDVLKENLLWDKKDKNS